MSILSPIKAIVDTINDAVGIIDAVEKIWERIKSTKTYKQLMRGHNLRSRLQRKYPRTKFIITDETNKFYQQISQELIQAIEQRSNSKQVTTGVDNEKVSIGIVCGPMILKTAGWISENLRLKRNKYDRVVFVAMNKAGEMDSYYYSANYLVTLFSKIFSGSSMIAYTHNRYDCTALNDYRNNVDILLCSVGSTSSDEKTYLETWLKHFMPGFSFEKQDNRCIGDFCLTPVDADGKLFANSHIERLIREELDPYPTLRYIREIKSSNGKPFVIFPIHTAPNQINQIGDDPSNFFNTTGKELIARAVLRASVANVCILDSRLAINLEKAVGGFLIYRISPKPIDNHPLRKAKAYDLVKKEDREITIFDPNYRLDRNTLDCVYDESLHRPAKMEDMIPSIVISEITYEDKNYDWLVGEGYFEYHLDGMPYRFAVEKDVRRPGSWASMSVLQGVRYLKKQPYQEPVSVWDMGCGSGVIGILIAKLADVEVGSLLFSDIDRRAVACTERNLVNMQLKHKATVKKADLFHAAEPGEKFHMIVFNPPFSPMAGISNLGATIDSGGESGRDIAIRFCSQVDQYLYEDGWAVIVVPDYVDDGHLQTILEDHFEKVVVHNRFILYPFETPPNMPTAFEIQHQETIEKNCNYNFETTYLGDRKYLSFRMRHYLAQQKKSKGT